MGGSIAGQLSDRVINSRKSVVLWGLSLYGLCLLPLTGILKLETTFWYGLLFFFIGFFNAFGTLLYSHAKELFPTTISGTVTTWINFFHMAGGAVFMPILGGILKFFLSYNSDYPTRAYHLSFFICFLGLVGSLAFYAFSRKEDRILRIVGKQNLLCS